MTTDLSPEYATLGGLLLAPATLGEVQRWLRPEDFAGPATRLTYSLILAMDARGAPVDPVTVQAELRRHGLLRRDGYPTMELVRMVEAVPVPAATAYYARLVLRESIARGVQSLGQRLEQLGATPRDPEDLFSAVADQLRAVDSVRRRWSLASGQDVPELPTGTSREPIALKQALAELDLPWGRRDLAS
jgi:replicative DNA helicase